MVKTIKMSENYVNQPQSAIVMNYLCLKYGRNQKKRGFGVLLFWNFNRKLVHVDNGIHVKRTILIGLETMVITRARTIVFETIAGLTTFSSEPIIKYKNIATYYLAEYQK